MPALIIPVCGYSIGSGQTIDDGVQRIKAMSGVQRGWSDYDATKRIFTLVHALATYTEAASILTEYNTYRLSGGLTFTPPWLGVSVTADYVEPPTVEYGTTYVRITRKMRET